MFCPEDGTKCKEASEPGYYYCPKCGTLWFYNGDKGQYEVVEDEAAVQYGD